MAFVNNPEDNFIEFQRFPDFEMASELIDVLEANNIQYLVDDSAIHFDVAAISMSPADKQIIVRIREEDLEKANLLFANTTVQTTDNSSADHYLYSFSDNDILDVITNPGDWTEFEVNLAKNISKQRGLKPEAEVEEAAKDIRREELREPNKNTRKKYIKIFKAISAIFFIIALTLRIFFVNRFIVNASYLIFAIAVGLWWIFGIYLTGELDE
jgi:hypothetical protein